MQKKNLKVKKCIGKDGLLQPPDLTFYAQSAKRANSLKKVNPASIFDAWLKKQQTIRFLKARVTPEGSSFFCRVFEQKRVPQVAGPVPTITINSQETTVPEFGTFIYLTLGIAGLYKRRYGV